MFEQLKFTACLFFTEPYEKKLLNVVTWETESEERTKETGPREDLPYVL